MKRIAVLTSGGDSPGMNACIANLYAMAVKKNIKLVAFNRGYEGLMKNDVEVITEEEIKNIISLGGSVIKTARSLNFLTKEGQKKAVENLKFSNIEVLIIIGGNGSFRGAQDLAKLGVKVIAIPGTIDNDLNFSERSLGFDTAVNNSVSCIDKVKQTMLANERGSIIEVMGRRSGDIALYSAVAGNANAVVVREVEETKDLVVSQVKKAIKRGVENPTIIVAEGILDIKELSNKLEKETNKTFKTEVMGYLQRGGSPTVYDRKFAMELAVKSIELIEKNEFNKAIGIKNGKIYCVDIEGVITEKTNFNFELYELFFNLNN